MRALLPLLLLPGLAACVDDPCRGAAGARLYVYGPGYEHRLSGDPSAFSSVGEALSAAEPGSAVCVSGGTFSESLLSVAAEGVQLLGAGVGETILRAPAGFEDGDALLTVDATDALIRGLSIEGAPVGLALTRGAGATLEELSITDNGSGLVADGPSQLSLSDVELSRNSWIGAEIKAGPDDIVVSWRGGRISGNGDISLSPVGGVRSGLPLSLEEVHLRDNAGLSVGDIEALAGLEAWGLTVERPELSLDGAPRLQVRGDLELVDSEIHLDGSPGIAADCAAGSLYLENVVISDAAEGISQDHLRAVGCSGSIFHSTFANLNGGAQGVALALEGEGTLTVSNTALVGYEEAVGAAQFLGDYRVSTSFIGPIQEAQLVSPIAPLPDLRPQSDSPLLDAGKTLGVATDIYGVPRPRGGGPDIGAYEY